MDDDDDFTAVIHLDEDEEPLMTFLVTTDHVHGKPQPILMSLSTEEQVRVMRAIAKSLRRVADQIEAEAGLAADVEEAMR